MAVELKEITAENFDECIRLSVAEEQEGFIAPNVKSDAQAKVYPGMEIRAIYDAETMVGFAMYGYDPEVLSYFLVRLMIDALQGIKECDSVFLRYVPENTRAKKLYSSLGFEKTGEVHEESGEILMRISFSAADANATTR